MNRRDFLALAAGAAAWPGAASAQTNEKLQEIFGGAILVENKPGAGRHADADRQETRIRAPADRRVRRFQGAPEEPLGGAMVQRSQSCEHSIRTIMAG